MDIALTNTLFENSKQQSETTYQTSTTSSSSASLAAKKSSLTKKATIASGIVDLNLVNFDDNYNNNNSRYCEHPRVNFELSPSRTKVITNKNFNNNSSFKQNAGDTASTSSSHRTTTRQKNNQLIEINTTSFYITTSSNSGTALNQNTPSQNPNPSQNQNQNQLSPTSTPPNTPTALTNQMNQMNKKNQFQFSTVSETTNLNRSNSNPKSVPSTPTSAPATVNTKTGIQNSASNTNMAKISPNTNTIANNNNNLHNTLKNDQNTHAVEDGKQPVEKKPKQPIKITSRIIFLKVGQIDTRNERYDAEAYIECTWEDEQIFKLLCDPNMVKNMNTLEFDKVLKQSESAELNANNLINLKTIISNIAFLDYDSNLFWSPQLYIENAIGELKEEIRHKLEIVEREGSNLLNDPTFNPKREEYKTLFDNLTVKVWEMRKLRGVFYERLELYDFPMDMQELSITLTSKRNINEVNIVENPKDPCSINTEDFLDQQEWDLFGHVKTSQKTIYDKWRKYERTGFTVSCYISRKPGYYLYNAYMLIFLITILGFVPFAFDPSGPQFRCQVTGLLILTSVNFRWIVTQRLPSVPYLTSLDKYAIGSLLFLVLFCVWHSVIGSNIITDDKLKKRDIDTYMLFGSATLFFLYNLFYIFWFLKMYTSIRKFHKFSSEEAQKSAKKKDEFDKSNESNSHTALSPIVATKNDNKMSKSTDKSAGSLKSQSQSGSLRKQQKDRDSEDANLPGKSKTVSLNFTDLPKP